jgi:hypothetical protein
LLESAAIGAPEIAGAPFGYGKLLCQRLKKRKESWASPLQGLLKEI